MKDRLSPLETARNLYQEKFSDADCFLMCGSVARGNHTKYSDLDLIVVYQDIKTASRDSIIYQGWPVEIFLHDLETINYFIQVADNAGNSPSLAEMITDGILISPENEISQQTKKIAKDYLEKGPRQLDQKNIEEYRYYITDLVDDMREPISSHELMATATKLYGTLTNFIFGTQQSWNASGKWTVRRLNKLSPELESKVFMAFDNLYQTKSANKIIELCEEVLAPYGGLHFEGFQSDAPEEWKLPLKQD